MKKLLSLLLVLCLTIPLFSIPASADTGGTVTVEQTVRALGIMVGDQNGNMNLSSNVTRAEFVKMMVAASPYKDSIGESSGISLFKDLKSSHWAVEYVKVAVDNGWFVGYVDGTFRPDNTITLEEAATAVLRLLGYGSGDLAGTYPTAQLSKFKAIGLGDGLTKAQGQTLTRNDCMMIFYNLMTTETKSGLIYAVTLGYTVNSAGELDYSALVSADMKGPFVLESGANIASLLPFTTSNIFVYRNGTASTLSAASAYDVYYYNSNMRTVWLYNNRVTGIYTAAAPSIAAPTSVTVAGSSYTLGTSSAAYKLSSMGQFAIGDTLTLLLGMNGTVVDVISASETTDTYYGVVISNDTNSYTDSAGKLVTGKLIKVACTDGIIRQYNAESSTVTVGTPVSISYSGGQNGIKALSSKSTSGTVNKAATALGSLSFADDIEILDTNTDGEYVRIYPSRLAGVKLDSGDIRFYALDTNGKISHLILNDVTGDLYTYGLLTGVTETSAALTATGVYEYMIDGVSGVYKSTSAVYRVTTGGALFLYQDGALSKIKNLTGIALTSLNELSAMTANKQYSLSENVQVYVKNDGAYYAASIEMVDDANQYSLLGYYDDFSYSGGGRIRVIVATAK